MGNYLATYRDATHTYRLSGASIIMEPIYPGLPCEVVYDSPALAQDRIGWLANRGMIWRHKAPSALERLGGNGQNTATL